MAAAIIKFLVLPLPLVLFLSRGDAKLFCDRQNCYLLLLTASLLGLVFRLEV